MTWFYFFCCDLYQTSMSPHVQWNMICGTSLQHHNASFLMVCCDMLWQVCDTFLLYNCSSNDLDFALDYVAIPQNILINTVAKKAYYNAYNRAGFFSPIAYSQKRNLGCSNTTLSLLIQILSPRLRVSSYTDEIPLFPFAQFLKSINLTVKTSFGSFLGKIT